MAGALRAGIADFRAHKLMQSTNRENAKTHLPMPVLTVGRPTSFGADLKDEIRPLVKYMRRS